MSDLIRARILEAIRDDKPELIDPREVMKACGDEVILGFNRPFGITTQRCGCAVTAIAVVIRGSEGLSASWGSYILRKITASIHRRLRYRVTYKGIYARLTAISDGFEYGGDWDDVRGPWYALGKKFRPAVGLDRLQREGK